MAVIPPAWTLISLRPQGQHDALRQAARKVGSSLLAASVVRLQPQQAPQALSAALACPVRIATSPAAVRFARHQCCIEGQWWAVGAATARALRAAGASVVHCPLLENAEGLLQLPELQAVHGMHIGLITAPDGRGQLQQTLQTRGAQVINAYVYQRQALPLHAAVRARILALSPAFSALAVTSQSALHGFLAQFTDAETAHLQAMLCIASSERLLHYVQSLGFRRCVQADSTRARSITDALSPVMATTTPHGAGYEHSGNP